MDKFGTGCIHIPGQINQPNMPGCIGVLPGCIVSQPKINEIPIGGYPVSVGVSSIVKPNCGIPGPIVPKTWF